MTENFKISRIACPTGLRIAAAAVLRYVCVCVCVCIFTLIWMAYMRMHNNKKEEEGQKYLLSTMVYI